LRRTATDGFAFWSTCSTRRYVDLAGERFRGEAGRLEERLWGRSGTKNRYELALALDGQATA
jgi:hypothetical protein